MIRMQQLMRWFGPNDPVPLSYIHQAGCTGVVTALHEIPIGDVWTTGSIRLRKAMIETAGLTWKVVESLPVHEDIKQRSGNFKSYIDNYITSMGNLAAEGIEVVTYNFMPVLDWVRTDLAFRLPDGSLALRFDEIAFAAFDLFIFKRRGARETYSPEIIAQAENRYKKMTPGRRRKLSKNVLLGLPGGARGFTRAEVVKALNAYEGITASQLRDNLVGFLRAVAPVAEDLGLRLAIHPDDPPFPVLGLPRIVSTDSDLQAILEGAPTPANGLCFCTGSLGVRRDSNLPAMLRKYRERVHFLHLRNTRREEGLSFYEADHLDGDTDMVGVMREIVRTMQHTGRSIPMRPDHGHQMLFELQKITYPGYSAVGRLRGLAELRGLELGVFTHPL